MDWFPLLNSLRIAGISTVITFFVGKSECVSEKEIYRE